MGGGGGVDRERQQELTSLKKHRKETLEILQQFGGYSFLSPSYIRNQYVHNLDQTGYKRAESPDEESPVSESSLNTSPVSSGYGSIVETPRTSPNENQSRDAEEDYDRLLPHDYIISAYGEGQTGIYVKQKSAEDTNIIGNTSHEHLYPSSPETITSRPGSSSTRQTDSRSPSDSTRSPTPPASATTPPSDTKPPKKNARTAYTNEQIQKLLKIFHENPYPDSEFMEKIAMDFGVAENKIKIWFQNKRARWRRRVNNNNNNAAVYPHQFVPTMSPMLSQVSQYGYVPQGHFMTSSPLMMPGYLNYATIQALGNTNFHGNNVNSRLQPNYPNMTPVSSITPHNQMTSSLPNSRTSSPHSSPTISNYHGLFSHYSSPS